MSEIEKIKNQFFSKLEEVKDLEKVNQIKSELSQNYLAKMALYQINSKF